MKRRDLIQAALLLISTVMFVFWTATAKGQIVCSSASRTNLTMPDSCRIIKSSDIRRLMKPSTETWINLPSAASVPVYGCSIAGDESNLVVFYQWRNASLPNPSGAIKNLSGGGWSSLPGFTDCNGTSIALKDSLFAAGSITSFNPATAEYMVGTLGSSQAQELIGMGGFYGQWGTRVAIAQNRRYEMYGMASGPAGYASYFVDSPFWDSGPKVTDPGYWMPNIHLPIGPGLAFTGDENGWVVLSYCNGWLFAQKGYDSSGVSCYFYYGANQHNGSNGFRLASSSGSPHPEQVALRAGITTAIWTEGESDTLCVAEWDGSLWKLVLCFVTSGKFSGISATTLDSVLYMSFVDSNLNPRLWVAEWDGKNCTYLNGPIEEDSTSSISSVALTTYEGYPTIALVENDTLKIKMYSIGTGVVEKRVYHLPVRSIRIIRTHSTRRRRFATTFQRTPVSRSKSMIFSGAKLQRLWMEKSPQAIMR